MKFLADTEIFFCGHTKVHKLFVVSSPISFIAAETLNDDIKKKKGKTY